MPVVEFTSDVYSHCVGDVVNMTDDAKAAIDPTSKKRNIVAYKPVETKAAGKTAERIRTKTETKTDRK